MRFAICNEIFGDEGFVGVCRSVRQIGYSGIELAPFTLGPEPAQLPDVERRRIRREISDSGLACVGLHWLLAGTQGLHWASADDGQRRRTAGHLSGLAHLCRDLDGTVMVLGSPQQRGLQPGVSRSAAMELAARTLREVVPVLEHLGVRLAVEPLGPEETDFLNTAGEAMELIELIGSPAVGLILDMKAMSTEADPPELLVSRHAGRLVHVHANDPNRLGPGMGDLDIGPCLRALREIGYEGWVSVEAFDPRPGATTIAAESLANLRAAAASTL